MEEFLSYIARTNLFNFIIFAGIIGFLVKKLNVSSKMETAVHEVEKSINESETAKSDSEEKLGSIKESMNHLSEEVDSILEQSEENAKLVGVKILEDAGTSLAQIQQNTQAAIENNKITLKNDLLRRASLASVEVAKSHIIDELEKNPDLHKKLIDESIEAIDGVEI